MSTVGIRKGGGGRGRKGDCPLDCHEKFKGEKKKHFKRGSLHGNYFTEEGKGSSGKQVSSYFIAWDTSNYHPRRAREEGRGGERRHFWFFRSKKKRRRKCSIRSRKRRRFLKKKGRVLRPEAKEGAQGGEGKKGRAEKEGGEIGVEEHYFES